MRRHLTNWRNWAALALALVALFMLLSVPSDGLTFGGWMAVFLISKAAGFGALALLVWLCKGEAREDNDETMTR
ncbi:MAG: hypothetical protein LUI09_01760 [Prevotellaceae bacterium]|nr:hypothetical protein [Prevotellaceae bacterium]